MGFRILARRKQIMFMRAICFIRGLRLFYSITSYEVASRCPPQADSLTSPPFRLSVSRAVRSRPPAVDYESPTILNIF
jgi:hypothetical protein